MELTVDNIKSWQELGLGVIVVIVLSFLVYKGGKHLWRVCQEHKNNYKKCDEELEATKIENATLKAKYQVKDN